MTAPYLVTIERTAFARLQRIHPTHRKRIEAKISQLGRDPRPMGTTKLKGVEGFRIRVGSYRVIYTIDDPAKVVTVTGIGARGSIYRKGR